MTDSTTIWWLLFFLLATIAAPLIVGLGVCLVAGAGTLWCVIANRRRLRGQA